MTPEDLVRADHEAMLIVGSFVAGQKDPASFERFVDRMFNEWQRRDTADAANRVAAAASAVDALGRIQSSRGALAGVDVAPADNNAKPAQTPSDGPPKAV